MPKKRKNARLLSMNLPLESRIYDRMVYLLDGSLQSHEPSFGHFSRQRQPGGSRAIRVGRRQHGLEVHDGPRVVHEPIVDFRAHEVHVGNTPVIVSDVDVGRGLGVNVFDKIRGSVIVNVVVGNEGRGNVAPAADSRSHGVTRDGGVDIVDDGIVENGVAVRAIETAVMRGRVVGNEATNNNAGSQKNAAIRARRRIA